MARFCTNCGQQIEDGQTQCMSCGNVIGTAQPQTSNPNPNNGAPNQAPNGYQPKSKLVAGLLGIFIGSLGIHNFYLGYTGKAIAQLLLTCVGWIACGIGPAVASIWGLVEGIMILTGSINKDGKGVPLVE